MINNVNLFFVGDGMHIIGFAMLSVRVPSTREKVLCTVQNNSVREPMAVVLAPVVTTAVFLLTLAPTFLGCSALEIGWILQKKKKKKRHRMAHGDGDGRGERSSPQ